MLSVQFCDVSILILPEFVLLLMMRSRPGSSPGNLDEKKGTETQTVANTDGKSAKKTIYTSNKHVLVYKKERYTLDHIVYIYIYV